VVKEEMLTLLATDEQPTGGSLSPDGTRLAYTTLRRLLVKPVAGGAATPVALPEGLSCNDVEFFPDGATYLVLGQHESGDWQVWRVGDRFELLHQERGFFNARLSPDGTRVALGGRHDVQVLDLATRGTRQIARMQGGEIVSAIAWSPDGTQLVFIRSPGEQRDDSIELADLASGATRVLHRRRFETFMVVSLGWLGPGRLVYAVNARDGATLHELRFDAATATEREIYAWPGQQVQNGRWSHGRFVYVRGTTRYGVYVGEAGLRPRLERITTGDGQVRRLAGWTDDGKVVFAGDGSGSFDVVAQDPAGTAALWVGGPAPEMPDSLAGGAVIFQRVDGDRVEIWRASPRGDPDRITSVPTADAAANVVRCAGDRAAPCVLADAARPGVARYSLLWPSSEEKGRVIAELPVSSRFLRSHALSPDGETLAIVGGGESVITFDVASGERRDLEVGGGIELQSVSWSHDGSAVLVTGIGWRGHNFQALRVGRDGTVAPITHDESLWTWRLQESGDGRVAAIGLEFVMDLAMLEGL
jgi:WD40 repeat protein